MSEVPIGDTRGEVCSTLVAFGELIRYHGVKTELPQLASLDITSIWGHIREQLRIRLPEWPLSFQSAYEAIQGTTGDPYRTTVRRVNVETGEIEAVPAPNGIDFTGLNIRGIPPSRYSIKQAIASQYPVGCGIGITEGFDDAAVASSGRIRAPSPSEPLIDGAALVLCGWVDSEELFQCRNMDGTNWGDNGYGWIPYRYVCQSVWSHELVVIVSV